jgi:hypothetical protein
LPQTDKHILFPDAGSVINNGVYGNYKRLEQRLESSGIRLQVADWGQFATKKADGGKDCDELGANFNYALIESSAYFAQDSDLLKVLWAGLSKKPSKPKRDYFKALVNCQKLKHLPMSRAIRIDAWKQAFKHSKTS